MMAAKSSNLRDLPVTCKHCPATVVNLEESYVNYNRGDGLIPAHLHLNLLYRCAACDGRFVVRGAIYLDRLYYGDFHVDGTVCDESPETQQARRETESAIRTGQTLTERRASVQTERASVG
jgi:hypothetical protein